MDNRPRIAAVVVFSPDAHESLPSSVMRDLREKYMVETVTMMEFDPMHGYPTMQLRSIQPPVQGTV